MMEMNNNGLPVGRHSNFRPLTALAAVLLGAGLLATSQPGFYEQLAATLSIAGGLVIAIRLGRAREKPSSNEDVQRHAAAALVSISEAVITTDLHGRITTLNPMAAALTGWTENEAIGQALDTVLHIIDQDTRLSIDNVVLQAMHTGSTVRLPHTLLIAKDGSEHQVQHAAAPIRDARHHLLGSVLVLHDVTEKQAQLEQITWRAGHDILTSLPNRSLLADRMELAIANAQRQQHLLLVCLLDLDGFKPVNDRYGHEVGDKLLVEIAQRLSHCVRGGDTVARLGGDEFVLLVGNIHSMTEIEPFFNRVLEEIGRPFTCDGMSTQVSASIGITVFPFDDHEPDTLLRHADQAMYEAKQTGRKRFHLFDAEMDLSIQKQHKLMMRVEQALYNRELCLYYQPKVNMRSGQIIGMEALLRWNDPERGLVGPLEFLPQLEKSDLIVRIGQWVIEEVLLKLVEWRAAGHAWTVSVNIAARHLQRPDFIASLQHAFSKHPELPYECLELEILESSALADMAHARDIIFSGRALGFQFSLDDFGSGYASLAYMRDLPVNTLKIDQTFVRDILNDKDDRTLIEGILTIARVFNRDVIAEGVETPEHGVLLMNLGCEFAQGFGIDRPMPADQVEAWAKHFKPDPRWLDAEVYSPLSHNWQKGVLEQELPQQLALAEQQYVATAHDTELSS
ncbi:MAG: EAL domain-containing protein [Nitrosomonadales bacterium]|nr:EAL domain-containing protein [Nitrosomonadales bacterium]